MFFLQDPGPTYWIVTAARPTDFADTPGFGFPVRFQLQVADGPEADGFGGFADESKKDFKNPGVGMVSYSGKMKGRIVRLQASKLNRPRGSGGHMLALGEMRVYSKGKLVSTGNLSYVLSFRSEHFRAGPILCAGFRRVTIGPACLGQQSLRPSPSSGQFL